MSEWEEKRLGDLIRIKHGYAFDGEYITSDDNGVVLVTPGNFNIGGGFKQTDKKFYTGSIPEDFILPHGSLVITMTDLSKNADTLGYSAIIPNDNRIYLHNQRIGLVSITSPQITEKYLYWLMRTPWYQRRIANTCNGANVKHTSPERIYRYKVLLPDLLTQKRIADILSDYDDLIENNNKRIALLEKAARELYKEWFVRFRFPGYENTKFVNGLPEAWEVKKVKDLVDRLPFGDLYKESDVSSEGNVIVIDQSREDFIGFHNNEPSHIASKDKPIALFGDHSCKFQIMITPFSLSENVVPFVGKDNILTAYLFYLVNGLVETTEYKRHWTELMSKKVLVANSKLQENFVNKINYHLQLVEILKQQNKNLTKQRDLLLPRLMSGKMEV